MKDFILEISDYQSFLTELQAINKFLVHTDEEENKSLDRRITLVQENGIYLGRCSAELYADIERCQTIIVCESCEYGQDVFAKMRDNTDATGRDKYKAKVFHPTTVSVPNTPGPPDWVDIPNPLAVETIEVDDGEGGTIEVPNPRRDQNLNEYGFKIMGRIA